MAPYSLLFTPDGQHFIAGGMSLLAVFDVNRNGEEPVERHKSGFRPRGKGGVGALNNATGPRALISTLDSNCDNILALGTYSRIVALYSNNGRGEVVTSFSLKDVERDGDEVMGWGVSQVKWSPDGRYLFVAERRSEGISVYDIRGTGRRLGWLAGRDAQTNAKLGFDVVPTVDGCEVWAGTRNGVVKMWKDPMKRAGVTTPDAEWKVHDGTILLFSCSGKPTLC
jgi:WD40 repeat protein